MYRLFFLSKYGEGGLKLICYFSRPQTFAEITRKHSMKKWETFQSHYDCACAFVVCSTDLKFERKQQKKNRTYRMRIRLYVHILFTPQHDKLDLIFLTHNVRFKKKKTSKLFKHHARVHVNLYISHEKNISKVWYVWTTFFSRRNARGINFFSLFSPTSHVCRNN